MIQHKTARDLMFAWHGGQSSALYAAASSGLVENTAQLIGEILSTIGLDAFRQGDNLGTIDGNKLLIYVTHKLKKCPIVEINGNLYHALHWAKY